jgi:DNA-binding MarR family transcriptional regulator
MEERFETFTLLIASISRSIRRLKTEETAEYNLKSPHVSILYQLYKEGSLTAAEICEACDEDKAAVSRSIVYLEQNGFLTRNARRESTARGAGKHYRAALNLTERGREVAAGLAESIDEILDEVAEGVTEEERRILYRALGEIDRILSKLCEGRDGNGNESD